MPEAGAPGPATPPPTAGPPAPGPGEVGDTQVEGATSAAGNTWVDGPGTRSAPDPRLWRTQLRRNLGRIRPYLRPYRRLMAGASVLILLGAVAALAEPWPMALLVDGVLVDRPLPAYADRLLPDDRTGLIWTAVLAGLAVTAVIGVLDVLSRYVLTKLEQRMVLDFRSDLFAHVQRLSMDFHDHRRTGELMANVNNRASSIGAITVAFPPLAQSALTLVGMFVVTARIDLRLALLSLVVVPLLYSSTGVYAARVTPHVRKVRGLEGRSLNIVHEAIQMIRVTVAFGREGFEHGRFRAQGERAVDRRVRLTVLQTVFSLGVNLVTALGTALVLGVGAFAVVGGDLTVGELIVVMSYVAAMYKPLETISSTVTGIQEKMVALEGAYELLDTRPAVEDPADGVKVDRVRGHIAFERVSFSYPTRPGTLRDISFEIRPGQAVGVVGNTGAGKTTLLSLMPRFADVEAGRILLDGRDIRDFRLADLRSQFSLVLQEPLLFTGTIKENIRYGRLDASDDEVHDAARAANAHDFICRLPKRYATRLGERGAQVSGGERQRISVARAFLKDAPVLLLDEPTSSIDSTTEREILTALRRLMEGRTTFMVAHRLSTIRDADLILVLDDGEIVQCGSHDDLLGRPGRYREMWEVQLGEATLHQLAAVAGDRPAGHDGTRTPVRGGRP
ncbi:MAG TPA: ABC transporter ATP-binding protein [Acidimicrobiales bacterium]|nr:ABC transporter ATP-binding protein [Acidimicrobiales bacterium]